MGSWRLAVLVAAVAAASIRCVAAFADPGGAPSHTVAAPGTAPAASPTASVTPTVWPPLTFKSDVVFTMAVGNDAVTNAAVAALLAEKLREPFGFNEPLVKSTTAVIPTTFSFADLGAQCANAGSGSSVKGAYVVLPGVIYSGDANYFLLTRSWSRATFNIVVLACTAGALSVSWVSNVHDGMSNRIDISPVPFALLASIYSIIAPSKVAQTVSTTVSTRVYPTATPIPAGGETSTVATTTTNTASNTTNPSSGANSTGVALLGLVAGQQTALTSAPTSVAQISQAIRDDAGNLVKAALAACHSGEGAAQGVHEPAVPDRTFCSW
jgi:hypothetical protein